MPAPRCIPLEPPQVENEGTGANRNQLPPYRGRRDEVETSGTRQEEEEQEEEICRHSDGNVTFQRDHSNGDKPDEFFHNGYSNEHAEGLYSTTTARRRERHAAASTRFSVEVSYLEIYNETLRDLFNPSTTAAGAADGGGAGERASGTRKSCGGVMNGGGLRLREGPRYNGQRAEYGTVVIVLLRETSTCRWDHPQLLFIILGYQSELLIIQKQVQNNTALPVGVF